MTTEQDLCNIPFRLYPRFFVTDAIDGAGKGAVREMVQDFAKDHDLECLDVTKLIIERERTTLGDARKQSLIPSWDELAKQTLVPPQVLLVAEPTETGMGGVIRYELARTDKSYDSLSIAHAFALDRLILYHRLVSPALKSGVFVFSDRSVTTSEVYQPVDAWRRGHDRRQFLRIIRELPGNQYALSHGPGLILIVQTDVHVAQHRLQARDKRDNCRFEDREFQTTVAAAYRHDDFRGPYLARGTCFADLVQAPNETRETTKQKARSIWDEYVHARELLSRKT